MTCEDRRPRRLPPWQTSWWRASPRRPATAGTVGEDLFGSRRRAAYDGEPAAGRDRPSVEPGAAKAQLVRGVFDGQGRRERPRLLVSAGGLAAGRPPATCADALEHLGVVATRCAPTGSDVGRARGRAVRASTGSSSSNPDLRDALSDPARAGRRQARPARGLLDGKDRRAATARLVEQSLAGTHRTVAVALAGVPEGRGRACTAQGVADGAGRAASSPDGERERLRAALAAQYGREVHLNVIVDPDVIGGIRVEIGDDVIDGTVSSRLDDADRQLAG